MNSLTLGSLFDGSGGFPLGGILCGIKPMWASEIEPFPIRVTTKRIPQIKHLGDINKISGNEIEPVDIISFGSPCQDLSVAGNRAGLDNGVRSNLFYQAIRIIKEMRCKTNGKYPRYIVWENVPGAFSSNKGQDFKAVLESIATVCETEVSIPKPEKWRNAGEIVGNGYSIAWRVIDAQYFGVPQRRKRIYLVADFNSECAGKILFESEGLFRDFKPSIEMWEGATPHSKVSIRESSRGSLVFENHGQDCRYKVLDNICQTVSATYGSGGNNQPFVVETPKTLKIRSGREGGGKGALIQDNKSATLSCNNDQTLFIPTVCVQGSVIGRTGNNGPNGNGINENVSFTLNTIDKHAVIYAIDRESFNSGQNYARNVGINENGINSTLTANGPSAVGVPTYSSSKASFFTRAEEELANTLVATDYKDPPIINDSEETKYIVRRLTPKECARLQGFPIWWCDDLKTENPSDEDITFWSEVFEIHRIALGKNTKPKSRNQIVKWLKNPHSDSAEYKLWGNGVALPCVVFVLNSIVQNHTQIHS